MNADIALYRAKSLGRDRVEAFSEQIQTQILTAKRIGDDIRQAIEEGQFTVYYQPQFDATSLEITGVEALVRWNHPERGVLAPFHFLKVAEEINVLPAIDRKVVELAYADFQSWRQSGFAIPKISVNMSSPRLRDPGLIGDLRDLQIPLASSRSNCSNRSSSTIPKMKSPRRSRPLVRLASRWRSTISVPGTLPSSACSTSTLRG